MKYYVHLTPDQQHHLHQLIRAGTSPARTITHARILLKADKNGASLKDKEIATILEISPATVGRVRQHFSEEGIERALHHLHPQRLKPPRLDPNATAHLIALACSPTPNGRARWTLRLLADKMVELDIVDQLSHETVRQTLKKTNLSLT